ncbi:hypothetical protein B5C26_19770 [Photorhabdus luminescens]|uniref:hypothetical protein n=1 Tax=Photorhabdus luminescens TaxID=29488 RepID=UPI000B4D99CF|nr:hypothetical protein [Photorhabdus luminescens]OWO79758.1 hypothetical protein B5C26_19770 [Photorhabdus luminescens]
MSYTYKNPGTWESGVQVSTNDVFQITQDDNTKNPNLKVRDYYVTKYDGNIQPYPSDGNSNESWELIPRGWGDVKSINLITDTGSTASIFANGLQTARVYVHFIPGDQGGKTFSVDKATRIKATTLVNYNTGEELTRLTTPPSFENPTSNRGWLFYTESNKSEDKQQADSDDNTLIFYVLCNDKDFAALPTLQIGVKIKPTAADEPVLDTAYAEGSEQSFVVITAKAQP